MNNKKRPTEVTQIAGIYIFLGIWAFIGPPLSSVLYKETTPAKLGILVTTFSIITAVIFLVSGIAMLKALNWGRFLLLSFLPFHIAWVLFLQETSPPLITKIVFFLWNICVLGILTRPPISAFFKSGISIELTFGKPEAKRAASVCCFIFAGFFLLATISGISRTHDLAMGVMGIIFTCFLFIGISIVFLVAGILFWGKNRWQMPVGVFAAVIGSICVVSSLCGVYLLYFYTWPNGKVLVTSYSIWCWGLPGIILLTIGIPLILKQRKLDKAVEMATPELEVNT